MCVHISIYRHVCEQIFLCQRIDIRMPIYSCCMSVNCTLLNLVVRLWSYDEAWLTSSLFWTVMSCLISRTRLSVVVGRTLFRLLFGGSDAVSEVAACSPNAITAVLVCRCRCSHSLHIYNCRHETYPQQKSCTPSRWKCSMRQSSLAAKNEHVINK